MPFRLAVAIVAVWISWGPAPVAQFEHAQGLFIQGRGADEQELVAYAEIGGAEELRMLRGTIEEIPTLHELIGVLSNIPSWRPAEVVVTTLEAFRPDRADRAERRQVAIAQKQLNAIARLVRVSDLERRETIDRLLRSVRASADNPGFALIVLRQVGEDYHRYYPVRLTPPER